MEKGRPFDVDVNIKNEIALRILFEPDLAHDFVVQ